MVTIKRALLSCHDKSGLDTFAKTLALLGVELVASGGTAEFLARHGLRVTTVESFTGVTEQLDGRVKTLHPKIHGAILAKRDDPAHVQSIGADRLIDLVVVNLYPFEQTVQRSGVSLEEAIEQIDIGGVALLRAAAKNFAHVAVVSQPDQYEALSAALQSGKGQLPIALTQRLAMEAFLLTSRYDTLISGYLSALNRTAAMHARESTEPTTPERTTIEVQKRQALRYGENPHQWGAWYTPVSEAAWGLGTLRQMQGKELSYNNFLDLDAALRCLVDFTEPTCAIVKHNSQCGVASATTIYEAYERAYACDAESAFGGIVGCNRPIDAALAERLVSTFLEVIIAPTMAPDAAALFKKKPNVRVVTLTWPSASLATMEWRQLLGGWLLQETDGQPVMSEALRVATKRAPTGRERSDLLFAWCAAKHIKSNAIVIAHATATVGIGQGQPSRVGSVRLAIEKAGARSRGAVAASDGFFPFPDGLELLAQAGVTAVIQPGGSIRDAEVIAAADRAGLAMLITGQRHFRH